MAKSTLFVTGTDTDAGKTVAALALLRALAIAGYSTAALKPVAAGASEVCDASGQSYWVNEDALQLQAAASSKHDYAVVNPFVYLQPIAPHLAAAKVGEQLSVQKCLQSCQTVLNDPVDYVVVEGAGGWQVPLNNSELMSDLAVAMQAGVVLVVGMRLGCINHALLTASAIASDGLPLIGWIANHCQADMPERQANIETLKAALDAPLLAELPYLSPLQIDPLAARFELGLLSGAASQVS